MADRAVLFAWDADTGEAEWLRGAELRRGTLAELAACGADAWVWLLDARLVQLAVAELPLANRRVQAQALPYVLEEQVLTPVDELGFASHRLSPTRQACAIFNLSALDSRLDTLAAAGIPVNQCVPDVLCLPWLESTWTLLFAGEAAWLRTGPYAGQRFAASQWQAFVEQALLTVAGEQHVRVFGADEGLLAQMAAACPALRVDAQTGSRPPLLQFADGYAQGHVIDLLPALPHRQQRDSGRRQRWWWASAALLLVAALAHAGFMAWHVSTLERQLAAAQTQTLDTFRAMFPHITRVEDVRVQAAQALAEAAASQSQAAPFLDLFATAGQGLVASPADGLQLESASYGNGALELRVRANDMSSLERYQQALSSGALPVQLLSVETRDDKAVGLLRVGQVR